MQLTTVIMVCVLSCAAASGTVRRPVVQNTGGPASLASQPTTAEPQTAHQEDADALRDDLKRMRALVQQMERNLAFVDSTQSPLKHQFQLEIDMWKTVIDHMEKRLDGSKGH